MDPLNTPLQNDSAQTLPRREALEHCAFLDESDLHILKVEAQAGQGKTELISQFEEMSERPFVWFSCTQGDTPPRTFCERFVEVGHLQVTVQKLHLKHCVVDCDNVMKNAEQGLTLSRKGKQWQAHNAFVRMCCRAGSDFLNSSVPPAMPGSVAGTVVQALSEWATLLKNAHDPNRALKIIDIALSIAPTNDALHQKRYDLLISLKRTVDAAHCLKRYRKVLKSEGFSDTDITNIMNTMLEDE